MSARPIRTIRILSSRQRRSKKRGLYTEQAGRCALCNAPHPAAGLILRHKVHRKNGGASTLANLRLVCRACHAHPERSKRNS